MLNTAWAIFSLLILLAAVSVARETRQVARGHPHSRRSCRSTLYFDDGHVVDADDDRHLDGRPRDRPRRPGVTLADREVTHVALPMGDEMLTLPVETHTHRQEHGHACGFWKLDMLSIAPSGPRGHGPQPMPGNPSDQRASDLDAALAPRHPGRRSRHARSACSASTAPSARRERTAAEARATAALAAAALRDERRPAAAGRRAGAAPHRVRTPRTAAASRQERLTLQGPADPQRDPPCRHARRDRRSRSACAATRSSRRPT